MRLIILSMIFLVNLSQACSDFSGEWFRISCKGFGAQFLPHRSIVSQKGCEELSVMGTSFITDCQTHEGKFPGVRYTAQHEKNNLNIDFVADVDGVQANIAFRFTNEMKRSLRLSEKRTFKGQVDMNVECIYVPFP